MHVTFVMEPTIDGSILRGQVEKHLFTGIGNDRLPIFLTFKFRDNLGIGQWI